MNGQSLARALSLELAIASADRFARRLAPSKNDALDLVQETS
jgi:DNA-directed RNA polymerase specialized sigma24 family protein